MAKLRSLVEEQHTVVRQGNRTGAGETSAAAHHCRLARGVMGRLEWGNPQEPTAVGKDSSHGVDGCGLLGTEIVERRQHARQTLSKHGLTRSWRPQQHKVVASRRRERDGSAPSFLSHDLREIRRGRSWAGDRIRRRE